MKTLKLTFESEVAASADEVWSWATSVSGLRAEMHPILKMTFPKGKTSILDVQVVPGKPLFRSWILLFGVLPIDRSDLTILEVEQGRFVEQSPMVSMRLWRHERVIIPTGAGALVTDMLEFSPRFAAALVGLFVKRFFEHRHSVLRYVFRHRKTTEHV
ncbi:hypothetical protein ACFQUU_02185 [Herbaspirillum sp. GCM10030257]|uniref:hypothetical protein n=1 Tax=Herbaspirillum sp. GCM10030257 TaxID=3273393 RepID=UPI003606E836